MRERFMADSRSKRKKLILELMRDDIYVPMKRKELAIFMQVDEDTRPEFDSILDELLGDGAILESGRGKLVVATGKKVRKSSDKSNEQSADGDFDVSKPRKRRNKAKTYVGKYVGNAKGFGFVVVEGLQEDLFVPIGDSNTARHNDTVEVVVTREKYFDSRAEARVVRIIERSTDPIIGTYDNVGNYGFVVLDNPKQGEDVFIPGAESRAATTGDKVIVELTSYGGKNNHPEGRVVQIIGNVNDPGVDILAISLAFGIQSDFPEKVLNQAERVAKPVSEADMVGRRDLRDVKMVTIDGEDAKDLDDAVSLSVCGDYYELGVHIADVTNYVQENSALDREALKRGTSVYLADRVIPMLPHALCNGICSLNQGEDRLALSCIMRIDKQGAIADYDICESVINVDRRMSYTNVAKIIDDKDPDTCAEYADFVEMFENMRDVSELLRANRDRRGSIDFDLPETKIVLDEEGRPIDIKPYDRNTATRLIESFMLAANETVAQHFYWQSVPFLYRVHEKPDEEKIDKLKTFIRNFGYHVKTGKDDIHPKELQKLLAEIAGSDEEGLIARLTLRSMKRACYSTSCDGHFGLACEYYSHFTSPIRRYPDLQIHRIIKDSLRGRLNEERIAHYNDILPEVAKDTSMTERRADDCERETIKLKKAQYMEQHIGEVYEGVISGVTNWGIYVELPNTVEGLVHVSSMYDYFEFNESTYELVGECTGVRYRLGQRITVKVYAVDMTTRAVDFRIYDGKKI